VKRPVTPAAASVAGRIFSSGLRRSILAIAVALAVVTGGLAGTSPAAAADPTDMVLDWNLIAINTIGNAATATPPGFAQPPPLAPIHLTMVHVAVYDAVNAIDRTHEPYLDDLPSAPATASKAAAVVEAAYRVLVGLIPVTAAPNVRAGLDASYDASLLEIDPGRSKSDGIAIGGAAAARMLAIRSDDGRFGSHAFAVGTDPGEWRPVPPLNNNVFGWVARVDPFALKRADQFRTKRPLKLTSRQYAREFNEVKALGAQTGSSRTDAQTQLAGWASGNPFVFMNRSMREIALARGLSTGDQARLFAQTSMSTADALIGCWDSKDHWNFWRPQTAIREALFDGNPGTSPVDGWLSLIPPPGYPEWPSGFNCFTGAMMHSAKAFFGTEKVSFQTNSVSPTPVNPTLYTRNYTRFTDVIDDAIDGRVYNGLHFRTADVLAAKLGSQVAGWVDRHFFGPVDKDDDDDD
jgi:hypothetical protein